MGGKPTCSRQGCVTCVEITTSWPVPARARGNFTHRLTVVLVRIRNIHLVPKTGEAVVSRAQSICRWFIEVHAHVGIIWMLSSQGRSPLYRPPRLFHPLIWTCTSALGRAIPTISPCSSTINGNQLNLSPYLLFNQQEA